MEKEKTSGIVLLEENDQVLVGCTVFSYNMTRFVISITMALFIYHKNHCVLFLTQWSLAVFILFLNAHWPLASEILSL